MPFQNLWNISFLKKKKLGHPNKMFRFPSPSISLKWVGRLGQKKKDETDKREKKTEIESLAK